MTRPEEFPEPYGYEPTIKDVPDLDDWQGGNAMANTLGEAIRYAELGWIRISVPYAKALMVCLGEVPPEQQTRLLEKLARQHPSSLERLLRRVRKRERWDRWRGLRYRSRHGFKLWRYTKWWDRRQDRLLRKELEDCGIAGKTLVIFRTQTDYQGKRVDCIRIRAPKPGTQAPEPESEPDGYDDDSVPF